MLDAVERLIASACDKLREAQSVARQVPDDLGGVTRAEIERALALTAEALKADADALRGNVALAHAAIKRCRFPLDEHRALFGALAELTYALEDVEQAAAAADLPESESGAIGSLPRQHLVPRAALAPELEALEARLKEFDARLAEIERQQSGAPEFADQDALIAYVTGHAGAQSTVAHELSQQRQVDIRGLSHVIAGLGRVVASFVSTVAPAVARVTRMVKTSAVALGRSGRDVVAAGRAVVRAVIAARPRGLAPGDRFRDFPEAPEMIVVPAGEFMMGSPEGEGDYDERPQHRVTIARPFAAGIFPVTRGEFAAFVDATRYKVNGGAYVWNGLKWINDPKASWRDPGFVQTDNHPVVCVNWHDATAYVAWLRERSGGNAYRLLSEAEWEYCCRAGTTTPYSTGETITNAQANFGRNAEGTAPVARFPSNSWGVYDMHGNVWEWCEDIWHETYDGAPDDGTAWTTGNSSRRVVRGGSWVNGPRELRAADRVTSTGRDSNTGFRVGRTLTS